MLTIIFNRLTQYRFAKSSQRIKWEAGRKNWQKAAELVKTIDPGKHTWLHRHINKCAKNSSTFQQVFLKKEKVASRIELVCKGAKLLSTVPVYGGMISVGVFAHTVQEKSGGKAIIIEKTYNNKQNKLATLEILLFSEINHKKLCAPKILGSVATDNFLSVFYEYVQKNNIATAKAKILPGFRNNFLEKTLFLLWAAEPTENLLLNTKPLDPKRLSKTESMISKKRIAELNDAVSSAKDKRLVEELYLNQEHYIEKFKSLPAFIMHGDLYSFSNIMIQSGGRFSIIDWDKWHISHIGGCLRIKPEAFLNASLSNKINHFCAKNPHVKTHDVWINVAIDNLDNCLKKKDWAPALKWVKHLSEISKE